MIDYRLTLSIPISVEHRPDEPDGYITHVTAEIEEYDSDSETEEWKIVGKLYARLFQCDEIDVPLFEVFDAHDQDALDLYEALFTPHGKLRKNIELDKALEGIPFGGILHICSLELDPKVRGKDVSLKVIWSFMRHFVDRASIITLQAAPLLEPTPLGEKERAAACSKLKHHWERLGFRPVGKTEFMYLDPCYNHPNPFGDEDE